MVTTKKKNGIVFDGPENVSEQVANKNKEVIAIIQTRQKQLDHYCRLFLLRIFDSYKYSPYSVRYMCKKIFQYGTERYSDASKREIYSLVGGLVFLRFFNPAIATCDTNSVNIITTKLTSLQRKNLTFICKVIQALSNGVLFGDKESFMTPMNTVIEEFTDKMRQYFVSLCDVEELDDRLEVS
jgi:Ras GTPase-activating-like protein IQGAP2/3